MRIFICQGNFDLKFSKRLKVLVDEGGFTISKDKNHSLRSILVEFLNLLEYLKIIVFAQG